MTTEEKIRIIEKSASFAEIPAEAMPPSHKENYYFVSYSHKDYKEVLKDILRLEEMGINIWYDNEMHIGENWREIAQMYISKFQCVGIIFYLTENSITSPACNEEVEYVLTHNKSFLSINKPLDGRPVESGHAMLRALKARGFACSDNLERSFEAAFSDEVLYLSIDESIARKAQKINDIPREDLLVIERCTDIGTDGGFAVTACRDNTILSLDLSKEYEKDGNEGFITKIDDCVFTNSIKLQSLRVSPKLRVIGESAFRNCTSLETPDISATEDIRIESGAFRNCKLIAHMDLSRASKIGKYAFAGCTSLDVSKVCGTVEAFAFQGTPIRRVEYVAKYPQIREYAFCRCEQLEEFRVKNEFFCDIGEAAFSGCKSLKKIGPFLAPWSFSPSSGRESLPVGAYCFEDCESLEEIRFVGGWDFSDAISAFSHCKALRRIDLDITNHRLPDRFAISCPSLKEVTNAERVTAIGEEAFCSCKGLTAFDMTSVRYLGESAFERSAVERAYLKNVEEVGNSAFADCRQLKSVVLGERCRKIGSYAFSGCASLTRVKILSEEIDLSQKVDVFARTDIKVLYLRSSALLHRLIETDVVAGLRLLYVDERMDLSPYDLHRFKEEASDEHGFRMLVQESVPMPIEDDSGVDITSDEINEPIPYGEHFPIDQSGMRLNPRAYGHLLGQEWEIRHARLSSVRTYFIEDVTPDVGNGIEQLTVSVHTGKSFSLHGSLIKSMRQVDSQRLSGLRIEHPESLKGKDCCIVKGNDFIYAPILTVLLHSTPHPLNEPIKDENGKYIPTAFLYVADGRPQAVSALDVTALTVFDDNFNAIETIVSE